MQTKLTKEEGAGETSSNPLSWLKVEEDDGKKRGRGRETRGTHLKQ